ncbi:YrzI family small protein [Actinomycetes bacterium NPDC127524]
MTLNILFFTVTIQKHKKTAQQCIQEDQSMKIRKEHIDRALMHRRM